MFFDYPGFILIIVNSEILPKEARQKEAKRYNKLSRWISISELGLAIIFLMVLLFGLSHKIRDFSQSVFFSDFLVIFLYLVLVGLIYEIITFPLNLYSGFTLEHKFYLSQQKFLSWFSDHLKSLCISFVLSLFLVETLYFLIKSFPFYWWFLSAFMFILFFIVLAKISPLFILPLFYKFEPLEDEDLKIRLMNLVEKAKSKVIGVFKWGLSQKTKKANAALVGWGNTRRIILSDTLLENYTADEIETVLAHELGHWVKKHMWKGMGLQIILSFLGFWVAFRLLNSTSGYFKLKGVDDIAGLPLLILVFSVLSLVFLPWVNLYSRRLETESDLIALELTKKPEAFISAMEKLTSQNLAEYQPNRIIHFIFHSHPSPAQRIKLAEKSAAIKRYEKELL